jgi:hypothetical protein
MDKILLSELKASWGKAISIVVEAALDGLLPTSLWIPAMWLHVIGCPNSVRNHRELLFVFYAEILKLHCFELSAAVESLQRIGFRKSFSTFISRLFIENFNSFDQLLIDFAEPISWNSYLLKSPDGDLHYTHLEKNGDEYCAAISTLFPRLTTVGMKDGENVGKEVSAFPLSLKNGINWYPIDFAHEAFQYMKDNLLADHCFFGHCCPEQSIIKMGKSGVSPFRTYNNRSSCGHGMYFFKMDQKSLNYEFNDICSSLKVDEDAAKQFQSFMYALTRVFENSKCDVLSPAILLFLVESTNIKSVNARNDLLPLVSSGSDGSCCNFNNNKWTCSCKRAIEFGNGKIKLNDSGLCAMDLLDTLSEISPNEVEKRNAFSLVLGVVDYDNLEHGVYEIGVMDGQLDPKLLPYSTYKRWGTSNDFEKWKKYASQPFESFCRPWLLFDHYGNFRQTKPYKIKNCTKENSHWNSPIETVPEYVFVTLESMNKLIVTATKVTAVFIDQDCYARDGAKEVFTKEYEDEETTFYTEDYIQSSFGTDDLTHPYWKLRQQCRLNASKSIGMK